MSTFGLLGLKQVLKNKDYAQTHPDQNATVYNMLNVALQEGNALSIFARKGIDEDGYSAWSILVIAFEGNVNKGVEAKWVRAELNCLRLDNRVDGLSYNNKFIELLIRLDDVGCIYPESMSTNIFVEGIIDPNYDAVKERLDSMGDIDLETCFEQVHIKYISLNKYSDWHSIKPRNLSIVTSLKDLDIEMHTRKDGRIYFPNLVYKSLSRNLKQHFI